MSVADSAKCPAELDEHKQPGLKLPDLTVVFDVPAIKGIVEDFGRGFLGHGLRVAQDCGANPLLSSGKTFLPSFRMLLEAMFDLINKADRSRSRKAIFEAKKAYLEGFSSGESYHAKYIDGYANRVRFKMLLRCSLE